MARKDHPTWIPGMNIPMHSLSTTSAIPVELQLQGAEQSFELAVQEMGDAWSQHTLALSKTHRASPSAQ